MRKLALIDFKQLADLRGKVSPEWLKSKMSFMYVNDSRGVPLRTYAAVKLPKKVKTAEPIWLVVSTTLALSDFDHGTKAMGKEHAANKALKSVAALAELGANIVRMKAPAAAKFLKTRILVSPKRMATDKKTKITNIHGKLIDINELHNMRAACRERSAVLADFNHCLQSFGMLEIEWMEEKLRQRRFDIDPTKAWVRAARER